jgi:hypothetical protein
MSTEGYIAMTFGIVFSLATGIGLMALNFYSRAGYDAPPSPDRENNEIRARNRPPTCFHAQITES